MRVLYFIPIFWISFIATAKSQDNGPLPERIEIFSQNSISNIAALGDTLWVGPLLARNIDNSFNWFLPETADSVNSGRGRLFSIALAPDTVVAGLGFNDFVAGSSVQTAMGFYLSTDGGDNWTFINPPLDNPEELSVRYGGQDIQSIPIIVPQQSPPFNVAFRGEVIFSASWASGIRRSQDFGQAWERILLPPTELDELIPEGVYDFIFDPRAPASGTLAAARYPRGWQNFLGFSTHIDKDGYVWAGTAGGINISDNAISAPADSIRWRRIGAGNTSESMLGNWVIRIRENPSDGKIWLTNWVTNAGENQGLVSTSDKGASFRRHLQGERINDVNFVGNTIFAAGDTGLFISTDNGMSWVRQPQIRSANSFLKPNPQFRTVAAGSGVVWIGTSDGLIRTSDRGETWQIIRVDFPLAGNSIHQQDAPSVDAYAYPNPFSISQHGIIRFRFNASTAGTAQIELFDFAMNRITQLPPKVINQRGVYEVSWDGRTDNRIRVANGPVFYRIKIGSQEINGKFLMLD
ncbi:MAG: hypothetical protein JJU41_02755 [Bacteroidetes bacterium]|nr:hypothetical protein [Bacteroidota bacterium]MCH8523542.1 hypothetical protein [Balneolales bacterium]